QQTPLAVFLKPLFRFLKLFGLQQYGQWSLLLAWAPIGGDALTVIAGILRVRWLAFVVLVFAGKAARYAVVIWLASRGAAA
ncbi:MAG: hypothetical protein AAF552_11355, partial [Pseudomonadota bacterium]